MQNRSSIREASYRNYFHSLWLDPGDRYVENLSLTNFPLTESNYRPCNTVRQDSNHTQRSAL